MLQVSTTIALAALSIAAALCIVRMARGGSLPDRVVALDSLLVIVVIGLAVLAARTGESLYLDIMVVASLLGFTGTTLVSTFVERRGAR
ncbi:MAG TPA: monovalent cation/H+ antiporter complex subunit F [Acidimicrobiia bacterium]|nr:monovalent cation/H+ antiporter complex subunit F [Acidimicrobiia bacterium]